MSTIPPEDSIAIELHSAKERVRILEGELAALRAVPLNVAGESVCIDPDCPFPEHLGDCPPASPEQWEHMARIRAAKLQSIHGRLHEYRELRNVAVERATIAANERDELAVQLRLSEAGAAGMRRYARHLPTCVNRKAWRERASLSCDCGLAEAIASTAGADVAAELEAGRALADASIELRAIQTNWRGPESDRGAAFDAAEERWERATGAVAEARAKRGGT